MLIDSHCHLDYYTPAELPDVLARAADAGVGEMVTIGTRLKQSVEIRGLAEAHANLWCTVGVHPHRGFETVSIAYKGRVEHHDSSGGGGIIGEGDVQWMTAASGILHKEYHESEWSKKGGDFQMVQLWTNLPAQFKMSAPKYQAITNEMMGKAVLPGDAGVIDVIAGSYNGTPGPASTFTPIHLMNAKLSKGGCASFEFPASYNTALLVIEGRITVNDTEAVPADHLALFENEGETFTIAASENSIVLIMSGEPIKEPIAAHGPFVMNTKEELIRAFEDFNKGKFGYLED